MCQDKSNLLEFYTDIILRIFLMPSVLLKGGSLALVVQTLDNAIHRINHYPADKYWENRLHYPLDSVIHLLDNWTLLVFLRGEMGLNLE